MRPNNNKSIEFKAQIITIVIPVLAFLAGAAVNAFTIAEKIATKPYVDDKAMEMRHYTDEKAISTLKEAFEHADMGKQQMMLELERSNSTIRSMDVKIDLLQKSLDNLSQPYRHYR